MGEYHHTCETCGLRMAYPYGDDPEAAASHLTELALYHRVKHHPEEGG